MAVLQPGANEQLGSIPFGTLIGGPLVAAVEAQATAARSTVDFIRDVGFDDAGNVRNVTFKYESLTAESPPSATTITLEVPILTIVPVPFIRIDDISIQFKASITAETALQDTSSQSKSAELSAGVSASYWFVKAKLNASYSSKKDSRSTRDSKYAVEYTMDVNVHAVQDDLPAGLAKILNILTDSIQAK